jgi:hypothetical protein
VLTEPVDLLVALVCLTGVAECDDRRRDVQDDPGDDHSGDGPEQCRNIGSKNQWATSSAAQDQDQVAAVADDRDEEHDPCAFFLGSHRRLQCSLSPTHVKNS